MDSILLQYYLDRFRTNGSCIKDCDLAIILQDNPMICDYKLACFNNIKNCKYLRERVELESYE